MTLFRELPEANRDKFVDISLQSQNNTRVTFLDVGRRAQFFLTVILLLGVVLVSLLIQQSKHPPRSMAVALACFLGGLISVGFLHAVDFEISRLVLLRATNRLRGIFRSEIPVEAADTPPISLRWMFATSALAYLAFLLWIIGSGVVYLAVTAQDEPATPAPNVTPIVTAQQPSNPLDKTSVSQPVQGVSSKEVAERSKWTVSDTVATASGVFAFLQFVALMATVWVMRDTARRQLRAYMLPSTFSIFEGSTMSPPMPNRANDIFYVVEMKNFGQTPAYRMLSWARMEVIEPINEDKLIVPPLADVSSTTVPFNGGTSKSRWFDRALSAAEIADIQSGVRYIYIHGRIEYRDVYGKQRYSNFRVAYSGLFPPVNAAMVFRDKGNESS
jgi:hypothetical protein